MSFLAIGKTVLFSSLPTGTRIVFHLFLLSADFLTKSTFLKNSFRNTIRVSNRMDPDQARRFLQRLSADNTSR